MSLTLWQVSTVKLEHDRDVVLARQRSRQIARLLAFDPQDQSRIATAVSEIVRNAFRYGQSGTVTFQVNVGAPTPEFQILVQDKGPGIADLDAIRGGCYRSETGMGLGIIGSQRLMDRFDLTSAPGKGTTVLLGKTLPQKSRHLSTSDLTKLMDELVHLASDDPVDELRQQNTELLKTLNELNRSQAALKQTNDELEETNRGVVALYTELDEKAESLKRASEQKTKFVSHVSHEIRTPVTSIISLADLLLAHTDGLLTAEQELQIRLVKKAAAGLSDMVDDLLDLARMEAGKVTIRPASFALEELFATLRGMFRPIAASKPTVDLVFEDVPAMPPPYTDEAKVGQILRNLVSNGLKYTEAGEVRVSARENKGGFVTFSVSDTGPGISPADQERIFEDFTRLETQWQRQIKGTGLGLSLSRQLAGLLGGRIWVESELGRGSVFHLTIPRHLTLEPAASQPLTQAAEPVAAIAAAAASTTAAASASSRKSILLIDDDEIARYLLSELLTQRGYQIFEATNGLDGLRQAAALHPALIVLDVNMPEMSGLAVLATLRQGAATKDLPAIIYSNHEFSPGERRQLEALGCPIIPKSNVSRERLEGLLGAALGRLGRTVEERSL